MSTGVNLYNVLIPFQSGIPFADAVSDTAGGYHGYWASNLTDINSNYGSADDLKSLVNAAHTKVCYLPRDNFSPVEC